MTVFDVPFSSQYTDMGDHEWRARGCGVASLKMVMDYWHIQNSANQALSLDELLAQGLALGAHLEGIGWSHAGLARLAKHYGYASHNEDFAEKGKTPKTLEESWTLLERALVDGPVLASVYSGFDPARKGGHIVVVRGADEHLVYINDPEALGAPDGIRAVPKTMFLDAFKRRFIVVTP